MIVPICFESGRLSEDMPRVELGTCDEDQKDIFRLRRDVYVRAGFLPATFPPLFSDPFDAAAATLGLTARANGLLLGGMRISVSQPHDGAATLPCGSLESVKRERLMSDAALVEFSRFVLTPELPLFSRTSVSAALVRAGLLISRVLEAQSIFLASRPGLVRFYSSTMGFEPISPPQQFPPGPGAEPIIVMSRKSVERRKIRFPFFQISAAEIAEARGALAHASLHLPSLKSILPPKARIEVGG
jgi:hypothetical protein